MKASGLKLALLAVAVIGLAGGGLVAVGADADKPADATKAMDGKCAMHTHRAEMVKMVDELDGLLVSAKKSADAGDAKAASADLEKAQAMLAKMKEHMKACPMMSKADKPVNTRCPIMGGKIDPDKVDPKLTRQYKGQTIGFCCAGCPERWDKLSDAEKQAKFEKVVPTGQKPSAGHEGHGGH